MDAPAHSSRVAQQNLTELRFELLQHPAYSADLAPSDFCLFRKLKTFLAAQKFVCNEETVQTVNDYFESL